MKTILLVDNDIEVLECLCMFFELEGLHPVTAFDGREALERVISHPPNIIVTDGHMPLVDGMTLGRMLKARHLTSAIPLILLSSSMPFERSHPFDRVFRKPVSLGELAVAVRSLLKLPVQHGERGAPF